MKRTAAAFYAVGLVLASGAAFGVPSDTGAVDPAAPARGPAVRTTGFAPAPQTQLDLEIALKAYDEEQRALEDEAERVGRELRVVEARIVARGRSYYQQTRAGLLPAGAGFEELVDHAARVERTRLSLTRDLELEKKLKVGRDHVDGRLAQIRLERAPLDTHRETIRRAGSMMKAADDRRAAFDRAFQSSTAPPDYVAIYGADLGPGDPAASEGITARYGRLVLPVAGRSEVRKVPGSGAQGPSLELFATPGATARAIAAGRVLFSDKYLDLGDTVIIDHGEDMFSVYGNLAEPGVRMGDLVRNGEVVGALGSRYGEGRVMLHFELRKNERAVEPGPWFGL